VSNSRPDRDLETYQRKPDFHELQRADAFSGAE
jgi:hypothetical protein